MRRPWIVFGVLGVVLFAGVRPGGGQTGCADAAYPERYSLKVAVDEVILTFHAADAHGLPVNDLKVGELNLLDNGKPPRRILDFKILKDLPIRAGILMDTSSSMTNDLATNRTISARYAQHVLRQTTDQAFVMNFGYISKITQPWTSDPRALTLGVLKATPGKENPRPGTALVDAVYRTCLYQFGNIDHAASGNFILLFSDGEDNASHMYLKDAVDICQHTNTAVYAFSPASEPGSGSTGLGTLAELTLQTGGRIFRSDDSEASIAADLLAIEEDLRNQYRVVYKPGELKHDGSFHSVVLVAPERVDTVTSRSGYYAPRR